MELPDVLIIHLPMILFQFRIFFLLPFSNSIAINKVWLEKGEFEHNRVFAFFAEICFWRTYFSSYSGRALLIFWIAFFRQIHVLFVNLTSYMRLVCLSCIFVFWVAISRFDKRVLDKPVWFSCIFNKLSWKNVFCKKAFGRLKILEIKKEKQKIVYLAFSTCSQLGLDYSRIWISHWASWRLGLRCRSVLLSIPSVFLVTPL
jgi:hypothetical protein